MKKMLKKTIKIAIPVLIFIIFLFTGNAEFIITDIYPPNNTQIIENSADIEESNNFIINSYDVKKDFIVISQNRFVKLCACSVFVDKITIKNIGSVKDTYTFYLDNEYSKLTANYAVLEPGQSAEILNYITPGCNEIKKDISILIESGSGQSKEIIQTLETITCNNINITPINTIINTTPCATSIVKFSISNPLDFEEYYELDTKVFPDLVTFSENPVHLTHGQKKDVFVYFNLNCSIYGGYQEIISVQTKNTALETNLPVLINISRDYDFEISANEKNQACNYLYTYIPITIKNNANISNSYKLSLLPKSKWFNLINDTIKLSQYQEKTVYIESNPRWKQASPAVLKLDVISDLGQIEKAAEFIINVTDCYDFELIMDNKKTICSDDKEIDFTIINKGSKDFTIFDLNIISPVQFNLSSNRLTIEKGQNKTVPIYFDLEDKKKRYKLKIKASSFNNIFVEEKTVSFNVIPKKECYKPKIDTEKKIKINDSHNNFDFIITNNGIKQATYNLSFEGPEWMNISKDRVILDPKEKRVIGINAMPNNYTESGKYDVRIILNEIESGMIYDKNFILSLNEKSWYDEFLGMIDRFNFNKSIKQNKKSSCVDLYNKSLCNSEYHIIIPKNGEKSINLSKFVSDPDSDEIVFKIVNLNNYNVTYNLGGSDLKIMPNKGYEGFSTFNIKVVDTNNLSVISPKFLVDVKELSFISKLSVAEKSLIILIIIVVLVLLIIIITSPKKIKPETEIKNIFEESKKPVKKKSAKKSKKKTKKSARKKS